MILWCLHIPTSILNQETSDWDIYTLTPVGLQIAVHAALNFMCFYWSVHVQGLEECKKRETNERETNIKHLNNNTFIIEVSKKM